jgi:hypothetical protein
MQVTGKAAWFRRRGLASVAAAIAVAGCITATSAAPAPAQTKQLGRSAQPASGPVSGTKICLKNASPAKCAAFDVNATIDTIIGVIQTAIIIWKVWPKGSKGGNPEDSDQAEGEENGGTTDQGLCLTATGGNVTFANCSANGTVWIAVPHGDGYYIESNYSLNHGNTRVLTVANTNAGTRLFVAAPTPGAWQVWDWFFQLDGVTHAPGQDLAGRRPLLPAQ